MKTNQMQLTRTQRRLLVRGHWIPIQRLLAVLTANLWYPHTTTINGDYVARIARQKV